MKLDKDLLTSDREVTIMENRTIKCLAKYIYYVNHDLKNTSILYKLYMYKYEDF